MTPPTIIPEEKVVLENLQTMLQEGRVVVYPTETCYGIACDLRNPEALKRLFAIKKRPPHQPVSALFSSIEEAQGFVLWNERAEALAKKLPGPLTLILPVHPQAPFALYTTADGIPATTLGIRVSSHPFAMQLARICGFPIATTSANVHGKPATYDVGSMFTQWNDTSDAPDCIVDAGTLPHCPPSTIIDLSSAQERTVRI